MTIGFWQLPGLISVAIKAPHPVLHLIADRIVLQQHTPADTMRTVPLDWDEGTYRTCEDIYWKPTFTAVDLVWSETQTGWLFLGYGFFLAYSHLTDSAQFFINQDRLDDVLTFSYPFLDLLIKLLQPLGYVALHAAVIGVADCFVLVPGKQNTGKSTTAAMWVANGGQFVTDDFCFVEAENPTIAHGFYPTFRLREQGLPLLQRHLSINQFKQKGDSKYFFNLLTHMPDRFVNEVPLRAIFCLTQPNQTISHALVGPSVGFAYLASSVAFSAQYRADGRLCIQAIKKLIHKLPVVQVNLSPNVNENYQYLSELMATF